VNSCGDRGSEYMNEISTIPEQSAPQLEVVWQRRIDALICGECSEDDFLHELSNFRQAGADSAWSVVALLDQRFRRGQVPASLFRSIESKIARRELGTPDYSTTVDLLPSLTTPGLPPRTAGPRSPADPARAAETERVLRNRYVLESRLGSGGMGTVFKALDRYRCDLPLGNRHVAIKFLHEKTGGRPEILSDLRREFYCTQALAHPNIVKVYEIDRDDGIEFFTMEFIDGRLLSDVIQADPLSLPQARAWEIISHIAAGLAHAHARNVTHADLKPQNIMITKSGEVRILDFGASSRNSSAVTPAYASCELLDGQPADPRDDLFALACVAYELLAGKHPFQRRRSTEARDGRLLASRPRGLTRRQWRTLKMSLAWRREDRSIAVADWIARLHPATAQHATPSTRMAVLLAALLASCALLVASDRQLFDRKIAAAPPLTTVASPRIAPESAAAPAPPAEAVQAAQPTPAPLPVPRAVKAAAAPFKALTDSLSISARSFRINSYKNFAEIRVRRSGASDADTSFTWWTEPASAIPGTDYVPQARTVQLVSKRSQMASLFVKLIPDATRKQSAVFYVAIGEPGNGTSLGRITRTAVFLPPK
jgi:serine/threonine protein kinase